MGLDIRSSAKDDRFGSYHRLHELRKWVYEFVEDNTQEEVNAFYMGSGNIKVEKCPSLLNHSDCDGGYINYDYFGIISVKIDDTLSLGDIRELVDELIMIKDKYYDNMTNEVKEVFDDFCSYVFYDGDMDKDNAVSILEFC